MLVSRPQETAPDAGPSASPPGRTQGTPGSESHETTPDAGAPAPDAGVPAPDPRTAGSAAPAPDGKAASWEGETTTGETDGEGGKGNEILRWLVGIVANATVLTALLVFFGWQRNDAQSQALGFDESILGMSTRDYLLRSVPPMLVLLLIIAGCGMVWLWWDDRLVRRIRTRGPDDRVVRWTLRILPFAWLILPGPIRILGPVWYVWRPAAFVAFPLSIGASALLLLYAAHLRSMLPEATEPTPGRAPLLRAFTAIVVGVALFWGTSNYATVQGYAMADRFATHIGDLTRVVVYSPKRLYLTAPGVTETTLTDAKAAYRYRYTGLRLNLHTGGHYVLVSDGWTPKHGVVMLIADDDPVRLEFVRRR
ncbi:hypothetical protein NE236_26895 [Actinoallomurus purpureus]|uniref:hypothetical protein n=1 Tax=Actinoallomurus purpureus TaxID=478114 RepID=UPI0020925764|nr:hypothetical protein [Actinoallomurus purpureus]MCO6008606.1 hypothetical protein [Actinoallomurus purpureus]